MNKVLEQMTGKGRVDWDSIDWGDVSQDALFDAWREASGTVQRYAEFAGYLDGLINHKDHPHCVQSACALLQAVRKAMGYTFP